MKSNTVKNRGAFIALLFLLTGCVHIPYEVGSFRKGVPYRYSANKKFECIQCEQMTNLYKLDKKDKVVCKFCFQKSKKKYLYH